MAATIGSALAPFRALDLTGAMGPLCGRDLAGLGVDVLKIEPPAGDPARCRGPFLGGVPGPERSLRWLFTNAGKRGVTLDITRPDGRDLLLRLVAVSDFLIESYPPGYLASLGLDSAALMAANPAIIIVRITPFGQAGPYHDYAATDLVLLATGGMLSLNGDTDRRPLRAAAPHIELLAGVHAAAAAMTAHYHRSRTGHGQEVDVSAQDCVVWTLMNAAQTWDISHVNPGRGGAIRRTLRPDGTALEVRTLWPCQDGYVMWMLSAGGQAGAQASMRALIGWMTEEGCAGDLATMDWAGTATAALDQETYDRLSAPFLTFFAAHTKTELFEGAIERGIQLAPVNEIADIATSRQLSERGYWADVAHPDAGATLRFPGPPVRLAATPWRTPRAAPAPGQDNQDVYGGLLGLDAAELAGLAAGGVI